MGLDKAILDTTETGTNGQTEALLQWGPTTGEVINIQVTAWDAQNFPGQVTLSPWSYAIPHEDVVFETGSAVVRASEEPKLSKAYGELQSVLAKYGEVVVVKLYVGGYTDTVGPAEANQTLSEQRAFAIARWFKAAGFSGSIFYQGFGEAGLAIQTADNIEESQNRRAIYLLSADTPAKSSQIPLKRWVPL